MGATFCHLAPRRSAIELLFGIIGKRPFWSKSQPWGHGRSWEQMSAIWRACGRRLNFSSDMAVLGQIPALRSQEVTGSHGRLREVTGGYGGGKRRKVEERHEKGWKETKENEGKSLKAQGKWRKWRNSEAQWRAASVGVRNESLQGEEKCEKWYWGSGGEGLQSKEKSSKGVADGLGF